MGSVAVERDWPITIVAGENLNNNPIIKKTRMAAIPPLITPQVSLFQKASHCHIDQETTIVVKIFREVS